MLQTNSRADIIIYSLFTLGVIIIGLPVSIYLLRKGIEGFLEYGLKKLPENYLIAPGLGSYSVEIFFYGLLMISFSIWYLFFDKGGQFINLLNEIRFFLYK